MKKNILICTPEDPKIDSIGPDETANYDLPHLDLLCLLS